MGRRHNGITRTIIAFEQKNAEKSYRRDAEHIGTGGPPLNRLYTNRSQLQRITMIAILIVLAVMAAIIAFMAFGIDSEPCPMDRPLPRR